MSGSAIGPTRFPLAPMSPAIAGLTWLLLLVPVGFVVAGLTGGRALLVPGLLIGVLYAGVWLWSRPTAFDLSAAGLRTVWPVRSSLVPAANLASARPVDASAFRTEFGFPLRIGVGGLWGGFGWLWTTRRGLVDFAISRTDGFVLVERRAGRPLLITPADPDRFVRELTSLARGR